MEPPSRLAANGRDAASPLPAERQRLRLGGLAVVAIGSVLAVPGVFFGMMTGGAGFLGPIVAGPVIEETLKPTGLIILLTRRRELRLGTTTGILAGAFSGLVFAAIENTIYLSVYIPEHDTGLVVWRWTVCVALHVVCSAIVGYGLARSSARQTEETSETYRHLLAASPHLLDEPREHSGVFQGRGLKWLVIAVVLHGAYNATAILLQLGQYMVEQ